ncbi:MAG: hypothetical protein OXH01_03695 [Bacteroidetes bacterium]|nr:hypothetical protein [Bacteroidota bacterium]
MFARDHFLTLARISLSIPLLFFSLNPQAQTTDTSGRTSQIEAIILEKLNLSKSDCGSIPTESLVGIKEIIALSRKISSLSAETMVSGGGHVGMTHLMTVTVTDNDPALPSLSIYELTVQEDMKVGELRVELSRPSDEVVMVQYTTSDLTAEAPSDYVSSRGMMVFEPQATHGAILVGIVDDAIAEGQEQLSVMLSEPKNAVIDRGVATLTIVDNDVE